MSAPSAFARVLLELRAAALERWGSAATLVYTLPLSFNIDPFTGALNANGWRAAIVVNGIEVASGVSNSGAGAQEALLAVVLAGG